MPSFATQVRGLQPSPAMPRDVARRPATAGPVGNQAALRRLTAVAPRVQAKLEIGAVDDPLEREADGVADAVMRMAAPPAGPTAPPPAGLTGSPPRLMRKCAACEADDKTQPLQTKPAGPPGAVLNVAPAPVHRVVRQSGRPLDAATRGFFEPRFGLDLGAVRVHAEADAGDAARAVGARAFTVDENIVFAPGEFAPSSAGGRHLLAHELAHVMQQRDGVTPERVQRAPPDKICAPPPVTPLTHPDHVSQTLIDRLTGKFVKIDGDTGEGCSPVPYPASAGEKVCTVGYGHQIPGCGIIDKSTGALPTADARKEAATVKLREPDNPKAKPRSLRPSEWLGCECSAPVITCPAQGEAMLKDDVRLSGEAWVHAHVKPGLDQAQFDALVDLVLHHGSIDQPFIDELNKYWCSSEGWNYLRDVYLQQNLSPQGSTVILPAFVKRRLLRVWPLAT